MYVIEGKAKAVTPFILQGTDAEGLLLYPRGYHLRGGAGYAALDLGLKIREIFPDWENQEVLFMDMIPLCKCKVPMLNGLTCDKCGFDLRKEIRSVRTRKLMRKEVIEGGYYRIKIVVLNEKRLDDVIKIVEHFKRNGLRIGRGKSSGYGLFSIQNFEVKRASPLFLEEGQKIKLISNTVLDGKFSELCRRLKKESVVISRILLSEERPEKRFTVFRLETLSRGEVLEFRRDFGFNGFSIGKFTSLGFGEIMVV